MMNNYSLQDAIDPVEITPLGQDVLNNPRAMQRMATDLAGMSAYQGGEGPAIGYGEVLGAEPGGAVTGQPGATFFSATPEDDTNIVMKTIGTVLGAPFNLLRGAKEGLEEAIGHPYAMQRQAQDEQYAMLASVLSDNDRSLVGMPVDRSGVNARQAYSGTVATGVASGISPVLAPRKTGITELLTGENRKQRALQMARLQAALKAQGIQLNIEQAQAGIFKDLAAGTNSMASARHTDTQNAQLTEFGPQRWRADINSLNALANERNAGASANSALASQRNQLTPGMVRQQNAQADDAVNAAIRNEELFRKVTLPGGLAGNDRSDRMFWDVSYPAGITANQQSKDAFSLLQGMREDERAQKAAESDIGIKKTISEIDNDALRAATGADYILSKTNLTNAQAVTEGFQQRKLDAQTQATISIATAGIDKIAAEIAGMADTSLLTQARARLEDIKSGALMNRAEQDNAYNEVRRALLETRMDLAQRAQANNDLIAKSKLKFIDADIARIESIIRLNGSRETAVGVESSMGDGDSSFGKALLTQAGRESQANLNALLGSAAAGVGTVFDRANRYELLGYEPGKDFGIVRGEKPLLWGAETPDRIVFPKGSALRGAARNVQEGAPAAKLTAPKEKTANPSRAFDDEKPAAVQSRVVQGQTSRAMTGRAADVLRKYPTPEAVVAAQKAGKITFEEGASALDALGVARRPRS